MDTSRKPTVFLTGATGLVGSYFLTLLLQDNHNVFALVRKNPGAEAEERVKAVLDFWDKKTFNAYKRNLAVVTGDITAAGDLGLCARDRKAVRNGTEVVFNCAAITDFNRAADDINRINSDGTRNLFDFALQCPHLKKINHISTLYVCGNYAGRFDEKMLDGGQSFNSAYEKSKFEAEKIAGEYRQKKLWIDIFRPPIILGESTTGKIPTFNRALYQALHLWNREFFTRYPVEKNYKLTTVFVDDFCRSVLIISSKNSVPNKTYHPFAPAAVLPDYIADLTCKRLGKTPPEYVTYEKFIQGNPTPSQLRLLKPNLLFIDRPAVFDSTATLDLLARDGFRFTPLNEGSFNTLLDFCIRKGYLTEV